MRQRINVFFALVAAITSIVFSGVLLGSASDAWSQGFASSADVKLSNVRTLIEAKDYTAAEAVALEVTVEQPGYLDGWMMLGYTRTLNGKFNESNAAYGTALEYGADRKEVFTLKAYNCRRLGDEERTRECYREILELDKDNVDVLLQFGSYEAMVESYESAAQCFEAVLQIQNDNMDAIDALAKIEEKLGNKAQVKYWLEVGLSHNPDEVRMIKRLSLIYLNEQNYGLSIMYLDKLLAVDPENLAAHRNKGVAYYQQRDMKKARESFEMVRTLEGKMDGLYGPLADCYRSTGQSAKAMGVVKEGIAVGNQQAWLYSIWGKILEDGKNYDAAISKFNKAVRLSDEPWSGYARKQIARQSQLKKREAMIAAQGGME